MIYPDMMVPEAPANIVPEQIGRALRIGFDLPVKDIAGRKLKDPPLGGVRIMRLATSLKPGETCGACASELTPYRKIDLEFPGDGAVRIGNRLIVTDQNMEEGKTYSYRLVSYLKDGTEGKASGIVSARVSTPPQQPLLKASSSMGAVHLVVDLPDFFEGDGEVKGVRIFRKVASSEGAEIPLTLVSPFAPRYEDRSVQAGTRYSYSGRTVFRRPDGIVAESELSVPVEVIASEEP